MSLIQSHRFEGCFLQQEAWWNNSDESENVLSLIMIVTRVNKDLIFTEQMLLWLVKEMALGEEW